MSLYETLDRHSDAEDVEIDFGASFRRTAEAANEQAQDTPETDTDLTTDPNEVALRALIAELKAMDSDPLPTTESMSLDNLY